jgi:hypothetical protein
MGYNFRFKYNYPNCRFSIIHVWLRPIKGFAVVHVLGILTSMYSAIWVSRSIINYIYGRKRKINALSIGEIYKIENN